VAQTINPKKLFLWGLLAVVVVIALGLMLRSKYVLDSQKLDATIKTELPSGTPKAKVIQFVQARKPVFCDDLGTHVRARMTGLAGNLIYRKDVVLDFEFDPSGRLLSWTKEVYLTSF
jgi:hypothetical protein